ncbi:hypothetical protein HY251_18750 [bacterium]|nr:hypothetical protein [bacterium]
MLERIRELAVTVAKTTSKAALSRAPLGVQETVERIRSRYEEGRIDAQKALEELAAFEEQAFRAALRLLAFPWATAGAIKDLYGRVRSLQETLEEREERIRELERRIRELESRERTPSSR